MNEKENLSTIYLCEQNLLKSCTSKLLESSNEIVHDNILSIFDNVDELNRILYKYLLKNDFIKKEKTTKKDATPVIIRREVILADEDKQEKKQEKTPVYDTYTKTYYRYRTKTKTPGTTDLKYFILNTSKANDCK